MKEPLVDDVLENEDIENLLEAEITDNPENILKLYRYSPVLTALTAKGETPQSDQPLNNHPCNISSKLLTAEDISNVVEPVENRVSVDSAMVYYN